ncbi:hypothetical protein Tco_0864607 [Tanacetum coccineum]
MVAYLEKTDGNAEYINVNVTGKLVTISEASIRSDLLFTDADGIDSLNNQAIFDAIQLMGVLVGLMEASHLVTTQAAEIKALKAQVKKLKKQDRPFIRHHKALLRANAMDMEIDETMDYTLAQDRESTKKGESSDGTAKQQSTDKLKQGTDKPKESTDKPKEGTNRAKLNTDGQDEGTAERKEQDERESATSTPPTTTSEPTLTIFSDDETIAQVLITMSQNKEKLKEKEKGVELKDVEDIERPRPTSTRSVLKLNPLPKIDPKDKGKKVLEEEAQYDTELEDVTTVEKKFKQLANDD